MTPFNGLPLSFLELPVRISKPLADVSVTQKLKATFECELSKPNATVKWFKVQHWMECDILISDFSGREWELLIPHPGNVGLNLFSKALSIALFSLCSFTLPVYHSQVFIYCCILGWKLNFSILAQNVSPAVTDLQSCASLHTKQFSLRIYSLFGKCDLMGRLSFLCQWQSSSLSLESHFGDQLWHFVDLPCSQLILSLIWGRSNSSRWNLGWISSHFKPHFKSPSRMGRRSGKVKTLGWSPKKIREASLFTSVNMKTREPIRVKQLKTRHQLL